MSERLTAEERAQVTDERIERIQSDQVFHNVLYVLDEEDMEVTLINGFQAVIRAAYPGGTDYKTIARVARWMAEKYNDE
jgi:hypothetical protein